MPKINITNLEYFKREEEQQIMDYIFRPDIRHHILIMGESGTGKTELVKRCVNKTHHTEQYCHCTIVHLDAVQISENLDEETFYSILTYQVLRPVIHTPVGLSYVEEKNSFLYFLENSSYIEEVKIKTKKMLISALSLIPSIGPAIYNILSENETNPANEYQSVRSILFDYFNYLCDNTGLIIVLDNIQLLPINIVKDLNNMIYQLNDRVISFFIYCMESEIILSHNTIIKYCRDNDTLALNIENVSMDDFGQICQNNLPYADSIAINDNLNYFYALTQSGNMKEIDEFIFQVKLNGLDGINEIPTVRGIQMLDDIKKDIMDLLAIFPEGIKMTFVQRILEYNRQCTSAIIKQSISHLSKVNYIFVSNNEMIQIQHSKYAEASRINMEMDSEEERFSDLLMACEYVFTKMAYEDCEDSEFVFCIDCLLELKKHSELIKHLGILDKYINVLYSKYRYSQICVLYNYLVDTTHMEMELALLFPLRSIMQLLDSLQKTSDFDTGLRISNTLSNTYNVRLFQSKFLLQSYHYTDAIEVTRQNLNSYESWSLYFNALQHLRTDDILREELEDFLTCNHDYDDIEYYYIILRNCGHLFPYEQSIVLLEKALAYFESIENRFVESTCLNNIGILYLYKKICSSNLRIAKNHFKKAKGIMHDLRSSEEYQSIINLGVVYFCEQDYSRALDYFEMALELLPRTLSFDRLKLESNILLTKYVLGISSYNDTKAAFIEIVEKAEDMPDPWIGFLCNYNLYTLKKNIGEEIGSFTYKYPGDKSIYGLYINNTERIIQNVMLGVSPHWRF